MELVRSNTCLKEPLIEYDSSSRSFKSQPCMSVVHRDLSFTTYENLRRVMANKEELGECRLAFFHETKSFTCINGFQLIEHLTKQVCTQGK